MKSSPEEYELIIDNQKRIFYNLLDEIVNSYPLYKINRNIESYTRTYDNDKSNLEKFKNKIFLNFNNLQNDSRGISDFIANKNKIIEKLNKENRKLSTKLNTLENQDNAAGRELESRIKIYYIKLIENIILFGTAIGLTIFYGFYLKKK